MGLSFYGKKNLISKGLPWLRLIDNLAHYIFGIHEILRGLVWTPPQFPDVISKIKSMPYEIHDFHGVTIYPEAPLKSLYLSLS